MTILPKQSDIDLLARLVDIRESADLAGHADDLFSQVDFQGTDATVRGPGPNNLVVPKIKMRRLRDLGVFYVIHTAARGFTFDLADDVRDRLEQMRVAVSKLSVRQRPDAGTGFEADAQLTRVRRGPGRPGWTDDTFREHWIEAIEATPQPRTFASVAANFRQLHVRAGDRHEGIEPEHLSRLHRKHGAPRFE